VQLEDGTINRKVLGEVVFNDSEALQKLNDEMRTPLLTRLRREMYGKRGLILLNAALIAEADLSYLCNNNVVLIEANKESQRRRLMESRGLSPDQVDSRIASQWNIQQKKQKLTEKIEGENNGKIWTVENSNGADPANIENAFTEISRDLEVKP